ncbi:hypothetical protein L226DRAFT_614064 [Lentinus tigrinus ALCF2SS1-7]|uniref:MYND-type domain-containing protein n=1 Tax=Lentinus tigrinus ALCF2SS1-6 TaxID=1328759 RepID=A0A5C2S827_9APHY|nr:hypothetical protein L227DRAFT_576453 [Lentinus tigrinus ALCF2SS1-6]RPD73559.1 hypothetical protein L226DRAFT_614064 [Lentinus tigrinus ALCF2SS1-7]
MSSEDNFTGVSEAAPIRSAALRRCHECARTQDEEIRLQRCAGCYHALYCSRSCQRKNWKVHKSLCRPNASVLAHPQSGWNQQLQDLGFESVSVFSDAFGQWLDAHQCALRICADVVVIQNGGYDAFQSLQKMFLLALVPRSSTDLPSSRNPSLMFQLKDAAPSVTDNHFARESGFWRDWEQGAPVRAALDAKYHSHPLYAGVLPILVNVEGFELFQIIYIPQFHPNPAWLPSAAILAAGRDMILGDMLSLIRGSINEGFPLRSVGLNLHVPALPGTFVRNHGTWTWQALFSDWRLYRRGQHRGLDGTLATFRSNILPPELMLSFKYL